PMHARVGLRRLAFLADRWVGADYLTILAEPEYLGSAITEIVRGILDHRGEWDYIQLSDSDGDSPELVQLRRQLPGLGMREHVVRASVCPYTLLPGTFDQYLAGLGPNIRYNFRRRTKALEREGSLRFIEHTGGPELKQGFADLVRLHRLR